MDDTVIYLVRHGITRSNKQRIYAGWSNEGLDKDGILQVEKFGMRIKGWNISIIYTSPLKRTLQTAQILNKHLNTKLVIEPGLIEMKMGPWEGLSETEVELNYPLEYKVWQERPADLKLIGRETLKEVQQRAIKSINKIQEEQSNKTILLVTHVAIMRCILVFFNKLSLNMYKTIDISNTSTYKLTFSKYFHKIENTNYLIENHYVKMGKNLSG